jgi:hypothetical protein
VGNHLALPARALLIGLLADRVGRLLDTVLSVAETETLRVSLSRQSETLKGPVWVLTFEDPVGMGRIGRGLCGLCGLCGAAPRGSYSLFLLVSGADPNGGRGYGYVKNPLWGGTRRAIGNGVT